MPPMSVRRVAMLSLHTSPLAQAGMGDGGGMNVYVRSLASSLARAGVACDVYTRAERPGAPKVVVVEPGVRVLHVRAGPERPVRKEDLDRHLDDCTATMLEGIHGCQRRYDALHANYWLSGEVGHRLKHELSIPLIATFHTLALVKGEDDGESVPEPELVKRSLAEERVIRCADLITASTEDEASQLAALYGADPERTEVVSPGVDHQVFAPGDRDASREVLGLPAKARILLFVGRIQPLKGLRLAVECLAELDDPATLLVVVGGPSGPGGPAELERALGRGRQLGIERRILVRPPCQHAELVHYYRGADLCLVPSRSESFGLVALEAAASGAPVVAAAVGGLRSIVDDGRTGFLVEGRAPVDWATMASVILDDPRLAGEIGAAAAARSRRYSWSITAARLRRLYADLISKSLVECS